MESSTLKSVYVKRQPRRCRYSRRNVRDMMPISLPKQSHLSVPKPTSISVTKKTLESTKFLLRKEYTIYWLLNLQGTKLTVIDEHGEDEYVLLKQQLERKRLQEKENKCTNRPNTNSNRANTHSNRANTNSNRASTNSNRANTHSNRENPSSRRENTPSRRENTPSRKENTPSHRENSNKNTVTDKTKHNGFSAQIDKQSQVSLTENLFSRSKAGNGGRRESVYSRCKKSLLKFAKEIRNSLRSGSQGDESSAWLFVDPSEFSEIINDNDNLDLQEAITAWLAAKKVVDQSS